MVAKNEKGEATSQTVEVTEIPEEEKEEKPKGEKPKIAKGLSNIVICTQPHNCSIFNLIKFYRQLKKEAQLNSKAPSLKSTKQLQLSGTKDQQLSGSHPMSRSHLMERVQECLSPVLKQHMLHLIKLFSKTNLVKMNLLLL